MHDKYYMDQRRCPLFWWVFSPEEGYLHYKYKYNCVTARFDKARPRSLKGVKKERSLPVSCVVERSQLIRHTDRV